MANIIDMRAAGKMQFLLLLRYNMADTPADGAMQRATEQH